MKKSKFTEQQIAFAVQQAEGGTQVDCSNRSRSRLNCSNASSRSLISSVIWEAPSLPGPSISKREHRRIGVDPRESKWIDNRRQQEWRDDQQQHGSVDARDELIDDLHSSLMVTASDYRPPFQADDGWSNAPKVA
jgi:hypothetical protein